MQKTTKTISLILALSLMVTAFAACGKGNREDTTAAIPAQTTAAPVGGQTSANGGSASTGGEEPPAPIFSTSQLSSLRLPRLLL